MAEKTKKFNLATFFFRLAVLPLAFIAGALKNKKRKFRQKILPLLFFILILLPIWVGAYLAVFQIGKFSLGYSNTPNTIAGTGSMYPTFPKGQGKTVAEQSKEIVATQGMLPYPNGINLFVTRIFNHKIGRGDIVTFYNDKTKEITKRDSDETHGFIKRVVALPGDKVEIKDGIFYLNGQPQKEPYIARTRSTFGGIFLGECRTLTIPENKYFVMGDNRKGSNDSRHELGLIDDKDIDYVLPWKNQAGDLDINWHDPANDLDETAKIKLDKKQYLTLLNEKRKEAGVKQLKYQPKLELAADKRGGTILKYDDFSFEATKSGYTMARAMTDSGYSNIIWGEAPTLGYFDADELIENQFEFADAKKFLLTKDYQEIGIAEVEGMLNGCPAQIIVQHFAGYVLPNYITEDIESWEKSLNKLREILPSWENIRKSPHLYQDHPDKSERIIQIIQTRIYRIAAIVSRMRANQWLTNEEKRFMEEDLNLYNEQEELANQLNSYNW